MAKALIRSVLSWPWIGRLPVRVRGGIAQGARWTLFPWTAYWRGTHEPEAQSRLLELHHNWTGRHIWDLGSHYGIYAVGLGRKVGATGSVAAFEPNPLSYSKLLLHIKRNRLDHVTAFPFAVSNEVGEQKLFLYEGMETTTSHLAYENETWDQSIPTKLVFTKKLDDMVRDGEIHPPDFIKMDIEGHGHRALAGAGQTIAKSRPTLMIGFHSSNEVEGVLKILQPLHYQIVPIQKDAPEFPANGYDYLFKPLNE